ncbi:carboxylesterase/lipase family protein [Smaragdicoccus niigatensis]|uniref:carboxylesterase/lipase family protein n=1 Tax=Smaragdicoccus niigatensis TaxID=359359 RepID=UPI000380396F|nr:carboxylesterase/lipase family protein [Smaragdicoccus niigatensis]
MVEVVIESGTVRGFARKDLVMWRGVPYAQAERLQKPERAAKWKGVLDCTEFGFRAPQHAKPDTSEDCLTLNIVRPKSASARPRPVAIFIHGGSYSNGWSGEPIYLGERLARKGDIVYVSINYRLGALGYLDLSLFGFPTNLGIRDQVAALQWVNRNIAAFGGDPNNVTIFGQSAGGNAVTTLMCVPKARGLFHRAIAQSPPAASVYSTERAQQWAREFAAMLGVDESNAAEVLRRAPAWLLVDTVEELTRQHADDQPGTRALAPIVDGDVLPVHPLDVFERGKAAPVPLLIGSNLHEGRFFPAFLDILPTNPDRITKMFEETPDDVRERAVAAYRGYPQRHTASDLGGDIVFWEPSILVAQAHTRVAPTFMYRFDFVLRLPRLLGIRATHGIDLIPTFGELRPWRTRGATVFGPFRKMRAVREVTQRHWINFIRDGNPGEGWPAYSLEKRETLIIDSPSRVEIDPRGELRRAWLGYRHRR